MAAPADKTPRDLNGKWQMNKDLSTDFDSLLQLQGIGWLTRKTIGMATITVTCKQYTDDQGVPHLDINQELTGGIKSTPEPRVLDWRLRPHSDSIFGELDGRSRFVNPKELEEGFGKEDVDFLAAGWLEDEQIQSWVQNTSAGWIANQIWGFQEVKGERRYVRKVVINSTKKGEKKTGFLVYNWVGA